jgi:DNA processing protein
MNFKELCASLAWESKNIFNSNSLDQYLKNQNNKQLSLESIYKSLINEFGLSNSKEWIKKKQIEHNWIKNNDVEIIAPWECEYPKNFLSLTSPPFLTLIGNRGALSKSTIAIVGSRNPSVDSIKWLRNELPLFLENGDKTTLSGGARGVDQEVHRISFSSDCPTICFLPSGLAKFYPPELVSWIPWITKSGGAIVSQFSPFTQIYKSHFFRRNELITLMSLGVFIVEARVRSGSMLTANLALSHGREIAVLPHSPLSVGGKGNLNLIKDGANMILNAKDLEEFWSQILLD